MERFSEVVIQNDNITATGYSGFNFGKCEALQNSQQYFFFKSDEMHDIFGFHYRFDDQPYTAS